MGAYLSTPIRDKESVDADTKVLSYGASSMQGWRVSQEDAHNCLPEFDPETHTSLFAVYDGHGGAEVAQYTATHLPAYIRDLEAYKDQRLAQALEEAFLGFDNILTQDKVIAELRELAGVNPDEGETEEEQKEEAQALAEEAEMPLQQLMERYGGSSSASNSHIRFEDEDNEAEALCAEADMPLQQLLQRYGGKGSVENLRKKEKFLSPALRAKKSSGDQNGHADGDDEVRLRLEARLVNGHSENENNENLEREHRMQQQQAASSSAEPCSSSSTTPVTAGRTEAQKEATGDVSSSSDAPASAVPKEEKAESSSADSSTSPATSGDTKPKAATADAKPEISADAKPQPSQDTKPELSESSSSQPGTTEAAAKTEPKTEPGPSSSKPETSTAASSSKSDSSSSCSSSSQVEPSAGGSSTQTAESTSAECSSTQAEASSGGSSSSSSEPATGPSAGSGEAGGSSQSADAGSSVDEKSTPSSETAASSTSKQDGSEAGSSTPGPSTPGRGKAKKKWKSEEPPPEKGEDKEDEEEDSEDDCDWKAMEEDSDDDEEEEEEESDEDSDDCEEEEEEEEMEASEIMGGGEEPGSDSGCTAVVALLRGRDLYVANAGDSRCVVSRGGKALDMSVDHKPEDEPEKSRILKAGGRVTPDGRVNGGLNLSRAIGDHCYKKNEQMTDREQMITALPDVRCLSLEDNDDFMILACDGIWNVMTSQKAVDFVCELLQAGIMKLSEICEQMFEFCLAPNTDGDGTGCDNMTCIIVKFHKGQLETGSLKRRASNGDIHTESDIKKPKADSTDSAQDKTE